MFLLPLLATFVMAGAGLVAIGAIAFTVQAQLPAVRKVLAESRTIAADRAFLVQITAATSPATPRVLARPHRAVARVLSAKPVAAAQLWRAAA